MNFALFCFFSVRILSNKPSMFLKKNSTMLIKLCRISVLERESEPLETAMLNSVIKLRHYDNLP